VKISPIHLIRSAFDPIGTSVLLTALFGFSAAVVLIILAARDWKLALWTILSFSIVIIIFAMWNSNQTLRLVIRHSGTGASSWRSICAAVLSNGAGAFK